MLIKSLSPRKLLTHMIFNRVLRDRYTFKYSFMFTVPQLFFICQCLEQVREIKGSIAEIGCAWGRTTVFINKYMDAQNIEKKYYAIDTFSGFITKDIENENPRLRKFYENHSFHINSKEHFDYTMIKNNINRVKSIRADVNMYDFSKMGALCFALLDVDLYRPTKKGIKELYDILSPNGIIIVDDCNPNNIAWKGAYRAYTEFMTEIHEPINIVHNKLGLIKKQ